MLKTYEQQRDSARSIVGHLTRPRKEQVLDSTELGKSAANANRSI
jgi:hypothetical protein